MKITIPNYENYEADDETGIITSKSRLKYCGHKDSLPQKLEERILKLRMNKKGYASVALYKNGIAKTFRLHRIIWESFNGKIPVGMEINHKNAIKLDCRLANLEIVTHVENMRHAAVNDLIKKKRIKEADKKEIHRMRISGMKQKDIAKVFNVNQQAISKILNKHTADTRWTGAEHIMVVKP